MLRFDISYAKDTPDLISYANATDMVQNVESAISVVGWKYLLKDDYFRQAQFWGSTTYFES